MAAHADEATLAKAGPAAAGPPAVHAPGRWPAAFGAAGAVALVAMPLGAAVPLLGAPLLALALGMAIRASSLRHELSLISRYALQAGIVVLGATISLRTVASVGVSSLPVMLGTLASALLAAALLGRRLGVPRRPRALIGVGTAICGASAIGAVSGVVRARPAEVRGAISTIFLFNLAAVLLFPPLGHLLGLGQQAFGLWAGTAVNDASSSVAAGFAYGDAAAAHAVVVKLTRTLMIVPVVAALAMLTARGAPGAVRRAFPWFLLWFLAAAGLNSFGLLSDAEPVCRSTGLLLTTVALAAVGLGTDLQELRQAGPRPLALGALTWATVACTSLALQALIG